MTSVNPFAVIERACALFVERSFARIFPSSLEPVHIARRLISALEASSPPPTVYTVSLHSSDFEQLEGELDDLCASWTEMIVQMAERLHVALAADPVIEVVAGPRTVRGTVEITAPPGEAVVRLRVLCGSQTDMALVIPEGKTLRIGRAVDSALILLDPSISRRHAEFTLTDGVLSVRDLGSTNGTFVGEKRVESAVVKLGECVRLGDCELRLE
jgi:hypothetical protein